MSITLAIETSSSEYFVAIGTGDSVLYHSADIPDLNSDKDLGLLLQKGLEQTSLQVTDIDQLSINIGPGGLGAVRSGVSFANGLSFGLSKPLLPLNAFELVGFQAAQKHADPVLITSNAADGKAYGGLYHEGKVLNVKYGLLLDVVGALTTGLSRCCVAGTHQEKVPQMCENIDWVKSDIKFASAVAQLELIAAQDMSAKAISGPATPLNELSELFQGVRP